MRGSLIPNPPLVPLPARSDVRERWIGRYARLSIDRFSSHDSKVGEILDVGQRGWMLIRWESGIEGSESKKDLNIYKDRSTAESYGPRLHPFETGGSDSRHF